MKIACVQYSYKPIQKFFDFEKNIEDLIKKSEDSHFVLFPENFTFELHFINPDVPMNKVYEYTEDYNLLFSRLAENYDKYIVAGSHTTVRGDSLYNTCTIFCPDGTRFQHDKTHLFPLEIRMGITPGNKLEIFESPFGKIGISICYETEFPEVVRTLVLKGAEVIFCPSYTIGEHAFWRVRHCCQARAIENQIYVAHSCMVGPAPIPTMSGYGRASILSPCESPWPLNGVIGEAETNREQVVIADVDLKLLRKKRKRSAAPTLKDRRPEIYEVK
ncbi:MAG: hypothetical protein GF353_19280 [Candidatus Lokiarchaeota archaeon]|nr:hypothetical protein [Candidatus Lokiarchaeota archaeon]